MASYKTILLTSCGLYPQVITEILYALSQQEKPVIPAEIQVITTEVGLEQVKKYLLDPTDGYFFKLCKEYDLKGTDFELDNIQLFENAVGIPLEDILSTEDNEAVADKITEAVRVLTLDDNIALHVSLAGGRRTISYYLGYALSLFGRPQDKLTHTIVSKPYESDDEFFYPNKVPTFITDNKGQKHNTQDARIQLAEIPYVRLRAGLPIDLLEGRTSFVEAVSSVPKVMKTAQVQIHLKEKKIVMNDQEIKFSPILFAWYAWLAIRREFHHQNNDKISVRSEDHKDFIKFMGENLGDAHISTERARAALNDGFTLDYIAEKNSRVNDIINKTLSLNAASFKIYSHGKRPNTEYGLKLEPENILIKDYFIKK